MSVLARDKSKEPAIKDFAMQLSHIQAEADKLGQQFAEMMKAKQESDDGAGLENDPEVKRKIALSQIEISTKQQLAQIKIGSIATTHEQRMEAAKEKTANDIAINRAREIDRINTKEKLEEKAEAKKGLPQ